MAELLHCQTCHGLVTSNAKSCPNCGQDLSLVIPISIDELQLREEEDRGQRKREYEASPEYAKRKRKQSQKDMVICLILGSIVFAEIVYLLFF